jgi:hypothetical protein
MGLAGICHWEAVRHHKRAFPSGEPVARTDGEHPGQPSAMTVASPARAGSPVQARPGVGHGSHSVLDDRWRSATMRTPPLAKDVHVGPESDNSGQAGVGPSARGARTLARTVQSRRGCTRWRRVGAPAWVIITGSRSRTQGRRMQRTIPANATGDMAWTSITVCWMCGITPGLAAD